MEWKEKSLKQDHEMKKTTIPVVEFVNEVYNMETQSIYIFDLLLLATVIILHIRSIT